MAQQYLIQTWTCGHKTSTPIKRNETVFGLEHEPCPECKAKARR